VSDGSTDKTSDILNEHASYLFPIILDRKHGKAHALNTAVKHATGEILVFQDARQSIDSRALVELISCFADPDVGAVSGDLILEDNCDQLPSNALGVYWKIEKIIRKLESESGSVVGVTGALYAIRRDLYTEMPPATILDDVFIPMHVVRMGKRVIFQPTAIVRDKISSEKGREFSRKVRTLTGNYQLLQLAPWILTSKNPLCFQFYSHKIIRLLVPLFLFCMLITSIESSNRLLRGVFWIQILFYILAIVGELHISFRKYKIVIIPNTFVMLNIAAICAFRNYVTNRYDVWK
jgi:cellulose synthase/poly-beta-1,6-N-acetylglucosamine synthase-like glycosyltransferase